MNLTKCTQTSTKNSRCVHICHVECLHPVRVKFTAGVGFYEKNLWLQNLCQAFVWLNAAIGRLHGEFFLPSCREEPEECREGTAEGDLEEQRGAEERLTWVENLHGGVGVRMLFMDHLSADLLCEDLPGDPNGIRAVNMTLATTETEEYKNLHIVWRLNAV